MASFARSRVYSHSR